MVRETLVNKHYLPLLNESNRSSRAGSVTSWDDPLGCLQRRRELLASKRSFSDSDLSKLKKQEVWHSHYGFRCANGKPEQHEIIPPFYSLLKDTGWSPFGSPTMGRRWCTQDLIRADLRPVNLIGATFSLDNQARKKHPHSMNFHTSSMRTSRWSKSSMCTFKKPLHKHSSNIEVILSLAAMTTLGDVCYICVICSCAGMMIIQTQHRWPVWWQRRWRTRVLVERPFCRDRLCCRWLVDNLFHTKTV